MTSVECSQDPEKMLLFFKTTRLYCRDLLPLLSLSTHLILLVHPAGPTSLAQMPNLAEVIPLKKVPTSPTNDQQNSVPGNVRLGEAVTMLAPLTVGLRVNFETTGSHTRCLPAQESGQSHCTPHTRVPNKQPSTLSQALSGNDGGGGGSSGLGSSVTNLSMLLNVKTENPGNFDYTSS